MNPSIYLRQKSAGIAIVTAIFLLVVVAGLGVAVVSLTTAQEDASGKDLQGQRAYQAARAGIEWALYTALQSTYTPPQPSTSLGCNTSTNVALPANNTLSSFTVTIVTFCDAQVGGIAGANANDPTAYHLLIRSIACNQPLNGACPNTGVTGPDYVQREIRAQL